MRVAVLGLGSAGRRHVRHLLELGQDVVGYDPTAPMPDGVAGSETFVSAIKTADAVIVASPNSYHAEHALSAIGLRCPVLVEKPLAADATDARRIADAADAADVLCGAAMNLRFHPGLLYLRRLLDRDVLGSVRLAQASFGFDLRLWRPGTDYRNSYSARADLRGGIVLDAIHELDYLVWLLGPVASVSAEMAKISDLELDVEDAAVAALSFESGALGAVDLNFFEPAYRRTCVLVGAEATARWDWSTETVEVTRHGAPSHIEVTRCDIDDTYRQELVDFLGAVEEGRPPRTPASEALASVEVATAIAQSASSGSRVDLRNAS
jgi:predicted dehydrogenase